MKEKLNLDTVKKIMVDAPVKAGDEKFDDILKLFNDEILSINRELQKEKKKVDDDVDDESGNENKIDLWRELTRFYFYNLIRKYSYGQIDPSEAKEVLENCIVKKYISHKRAKTKIATIKDDEHLTKKFTSDLYYSTLTFLEVQRKRKTVSIEKQDEEGEWVEEIEISDDKERHTVESIDYVENDLSEMISKTIIKPLIFSNYLMWNFKRLENVKLDFRNDFIDLPMKFRLNNNIIARYYSWNKKI